MNFFNNGLLINPDRLCPDTPGWTGHIPFAGWLMAELNPTIFVELGTHKGVSYSAFCQAAVENNLSTKCYAVDTWKGDEHAQFYDEEIYIEFSAYHQRHFSSFSQLLRMTFNEALPYFNDQSIDLLHIDGLHTYDAVKEDFEAWRPKISTRGIILFHDINVRERNFGVWKLWEELSLQYPTIEFKHSHGLGMLIVGQEIPERINDFLHNNTWVSNKLFPHLGQLPSLKNREITLVQMLNGHEQQNNQLNMAVAERDQRIASIEQLAVEREQENNQLNIAVAERDQRIASIEQLVVERDEQIIKLNQLLIDHETHLKTLMNSKSWKLTKPLRFIELQTKKVHKTKRLDHLSCEDNK